MKVLFKRVISIILSLVFLVGLVSCNSGKEKIEENPENTIIGFVSNSSSEFAAKSYSNKGVQLIGYNTLSDLLLAIENGSVDYGVLSDYELTQAENAQRKIKVYEKCSYKIDLCAYFRNDSIELRNQFNDSIKSMKEKGILDKIKDSEYNGIAYHTSYTGNGEKELKVICNPSVDLFFYLLEDGYCTGIEVNILENFAEENNYSISYVQVFEDEELLLKLQNGDGDMIVSARIYNSKITEDYLLSDSYFSIGFNLVTRKSF